ncbi:MAG: exosome complex RNA-binding protein Csl4 [Candidatus Bathyarchaeia archaeon]|jgi:exosome complex component CSL4
MKENERKSGLFVVPGDHLGVIEEFTSGSGTYIEDGTIHSQVTGCTLLDMLNKQVSVYPVVPAATVPQVGDMVTALVLDVKTKNAVLHIFKVGDKKLSGFFTGMLHISGVSHSYVDSMFNVCKVGDIMTAKVISTKNRSFFLSTTEKDLGVVYELCSMCGSMLNPSNRGLTCSSCGHSEMRKISPDYGKDIIHEVEQNES